MNEKNALIYKWLVGNTFAFLLLFMVASQGWIGLVLKSDASYLTWAMAAVFIIFWCISSYQMVRINREITRFMSSSPVGVAAEYYETLRVKNRNQAGALLDQGLLASALRARMLLDIHNTQFVANTLILLGLIGTVVGFVIAVSGLGDTIGEGESVERIRGVLGQIINGMGVALFTTLVGSILGGLWLQVHYQMMMKAVLRLAIRIVEKAEVEIIPALATAAGPAVAAAPAALPAAAPPAAPRVTRAEKSPGIRIFEHQKR